MFSHSQIAKVAWFALFAAVPMAWGQDYTVEGGTTSTGSFLLRLDETLTVTYNVDGPGGVVVPVLVPKNAAQADSIVATWQGTAPTSNLSNLVFDIHLYDNPALCGQTFEFDLLFYSPGSDTPEKAQSSSLLNFGTSSDGLITLDQVILEMIESPPFPLSGGIKSDPMRIRSHTFDDLEGKRLYWYADWNLQGYYTPDNFGAVFLFFFWTLNANSCFFQLGSDLIPNAPDLLVQGQVIDNTVSPSREIETHPLGGAGNFGTLGTGINVFDITDVTLANTNCDLPGNSTPTVAEAIDFLSQGANWETTYWYSGGVSIILRNFRVYIGSEGGCTALVDNFDEPPTDSNFQIRNFELSSNGDISADLTVPSGWRQSVSELKQNFEVQYFLRTDSSYRSLSAGSRDLTLSASSGEEILDPRDYYLEARIRRTDTGAEVSITNRENNHNINYDLVAGNIDFDGDEEPLGQDDEILDPGETVTIPFRIEAASGETLPDVTWTSGVVVDDDEDDRPEASDTLITGGQQTVDGTNFIVDSVDVGGVAGNVSYNISATFELLTAPDQKPVWFFVEGRFTDPVTNSPTSFRRYVDLSDELNTVRDLNAQDTRLRSPFDFSVSSYTSEGWTADSETGNRGASGWLYNTSGSLGPWIGEGDTSSSADGTTYWLRTPVFLLGNNTKLEFNHLTQFSFNQSGGLLEYRTRPDNGNWTEWSNLITDHGSTNYYNPNPFPSSPPSYLSGERVWMTNESTTQNVTVNIPQSLTNQYGGEGEIQFRFLFQDPSLEFTGNRSDGPTHWEVNDFDYETRKILEDNIFRIDLDSLALDACDSTLTFYPDAPEHYSNLDFFWYENLSDLFADRSTFVDGDPEIPFNTSLQGDYDFYVRVVFQGTERIYNVKVERGPDGCGPGPCIEAGEILGELREESGGWPETRNVVDFLRILDQVCDTNL
ncbi:MAG: hypothetical protein QNK37_26420 [Acidobacteriota bacterium]|nr:hypothetical protein [Acidobacteriota bacterium]